jgi:magnesium transporter
MASAPAKRLGPEDLDGPVAGHARSDFVALRPEQTAAEALEALRASPQLPEKIVYFYVTDASGRLRGVVPTRRLLGAPAGKPVGELMVSTVVSVPDRASVEAAARTFLEHRFLALPVVDTQDRLVGVVDLSLFTDEVEALAERRSREDVFQLIGVHVDRARRLSAFGAFRERFPWLLCNVAGGLLCAAVATRYEALLESAVVLALFVPVVLALAESVSIQSTTLTLQALHAGAPAARDLVRALHRELRAAALLGAACGSLVGVVAWAWKGHALTALVLAAAITLSMVTACLLGVALPTGLRLLRRDPRFAAGPVVLATADVATLLLYFSAAGWALL